VRWTREHKQEQGKKVAPEEKEARSELIREQDPKQALLEKVLVTFFPIRVAQITNLSFISRC
jgi:hypothetical protein